MGDVEKFPDDDAKSGGVAINEGNIEFELLIGNDVHNLRIDPAFESCICKIKNFI